MPGFCFSGEVRTTNYNFPGFALALLCVLSAPTVHAQLEAPADLVAYIGRDKPKVSEPVREAADRTGEVSMGTLIQVATAQRLNRDFAKAAESYRAIVARSDNPAHSFFLADCLRRSGNAEEAERYLVRYDEGQGYTARPGRAHPQTAFDVVHHDNVIVRNERSVNSRNREVSPMILHGGAVFSSGPEKGTTRRRGRASASELVYALGDEQDGSLDDAQPFAYGAQMKNHDGRISFDRSGTRMYFAQNVSERRRGEVDLDLHVRELVDSVWTKTRVLPFNAPGARDCHPAVSFDNKSLYFASDREGGYGGLDLYVTELRAGEWTEPRNLGTAVNTPGDEAHPFAHADGTLYFSSNGHGGVGGLDVFSVLQRDGAYGPITNSGTPYNSPADDFGYVVDRNGLYGYFSSARKGGVGATDIYGFWVVDDPDAPTLYQRVSVFADEGGNELLPETDVAVTLLSDDWLLSLTEGETDFRLRQGINDEERLALVRRALDERQEEAVTYKTGLDGAIVFPVERGRRYRVVASREGHDPAGREITCLADQREVREDTLTLHRFSTEGYTFIAGKVLHDQYGNPLPNVEVELLDLCTSVKRTTYTDSDGAFRFGGVSEGCSFLLTGRKRFFSNGAAAVVTDVALPGAAQEVAAEVRMTTDPAVLRR